MKKIFKATVITAGLLGLALTSTTVAYGDGPEKKRFAESQYRHDNMEHAKYALTNMLKLMKGEVSHEGHLTKLADIMASSASMAKATFEQDTRSMEGHTEAKGDIWENWDDYAARMDAYAADTAALAEVAKTGDMALFTPAFQKAVGHCKACHDKYRD